MSISQQQMQKFDDFLFTIIKESGGLEGFFNVIFYFLQRRTDFFIECDPGDKMGFPPGVSPKLVNDIFNMYQNETYKKRPKKTIAEYQEKLKIHQQQQQLQKQNAIAEAEAIKNQKEKNKLVEDSNIVNSHSEEQKQDSKPEPKPKQQTISQEELLAQVKKPNEGSKMEQISTYNGGVTDKYIWAQTVLDLTVQVNVPPHTTAKQIQVKISSNHLVLKLKGVDTPLIDGELFESIKADESTWTIEDNNKVIFTLEKERENIWKTIIKGDVEIDATQVDNSKKVDEFDEDTQAALRKIMYEQKRKQQGLPSTEEEQQQELLKKAWNAEGSPFKGTPFDPSKFSGLGGGGNFGGGGMM